MKDINPLFNQHESTKKALMLLKVMYLIYLLLYMVVYVYRLF